MYVFLVWKWQYFYLFDGFLVVSLSWQGKKLQRLSHNSVCVCVCGTSYGEHIFILNEPLNTSQEVVFSFWTFELEFNRVSRQRLASGPNCHIRRWVRSLWVWGSGQNRLWFLLSERHFSISEFPPDAKNTGTHWPELYQQESYLPKTYHIHLFTVLQNK